MATPIEDIPTCLFTLMGRVEQHIQAANALHAAQDKGGASDVVRARAQLVKSLNELAATNLQARQYMLMLADLEHAVGKGTKQAPQ